MSGDASRWAAYCVWLGGSIFTSFYFSISFLFTCSILFHLLFHVFLTFVSLAKISGGRNTPMTMTDLKDVKDLLDGPYEISKVQFYDRDYGKGGCCLVKTDTQEKAWVTCLSLGIFFYFPACSFFGFLLVLTAFFMIVLFADPLRPLQRSWPECWQLRAVERAGRPRKGSSQKTLTSGTQQSSRGVEGNCKTQDDAP